MTALQAWSKALFDLLVNAREELDSEAYEWFVAIATERIGLEAARLAVGEALRAKRGEGRRAA